jgi:hypothetical protein
MGKIITNQEWYELAGTEVKPAEPTKCGVTWSDVYNSTNFSDGTKTDYSGSKQLVDKDDLVRDYFSYNAYLSIEFNKVDWKKQFGNNAWLSVRVSTYIGDDLINEFIFTPTDSISTSAWSESAINSTSDYSTVKIRVDFLSSTQESSGQFDSEIKYSTWDSSCKSEVAKTKVLTFAPTNNTWSPLDTYVYIPESAQIGPYINIKISNIKSISGSYTSMVGNWE